MKVYIETFGCQMNRLDSELVTGHLRAAGHEFVDERNVAEVVLFNTCSVRQQAENKVYSRLGEELGRRGPNARRRVVGVLGCMAQREGQALPRRFPHVNLVCGPGQLERLGELIADAAGGQSVVALDADRKTRPGVDGEVIDNLDMARDASRTLSSAQAYVRVMRGCDNFCTYCIVPHVRGPEVSRSPGRILEEVRRLVDAGRSEITLLGQTVNRYKHQSGETVVHFSDLLGRVSAVAGIRRLRFVTSFPLDFGNDLLEAMRDLPNVCEYIHCPAQSGSDAMLRKMNRKYTRAHYDDLVDRARAIVPGVALAGDFIAGFPGETEADHRASAVLIRRSGYKNSFVFRYSPRPGTLAATKYADDVPDEVKRRRNNELLAVQKEVGLAHHEAYVGRRVEILVTGPSPRVDKQAEAPRPDVMQLTGRTRGDHIVVFDGPDALAGEYVQVDINDATSLTLFGQISNACGT